MNNKENGQSAAEQIITKPIKGWEDKYTISSDGKVYSIRTGKFLKPRLSLDGYERVCLCDGPIKREYRVHRLVAEAFIDNPENLPQINHKDFNKLNNYISIPVNENSLPKRNAWTHTPILPRISV